MPRNPGLRFACPGLCRFYQQQPTNITRWKPVAPLCLFSQRRPAARLSLFHSFSWSRWHPIRMGATRSLTLLRFAGSSSGSVGGISSSFHSVSRPSMISKSQAASLTSCAWYDRAQATQEDFGMSSLSADPSGLESTRKLQGRLALVTGAGTRHRPGSCAGVRAPGGLRRTALLPQQGGGRECGGRDPVHGREGRRDPGRPGPRRRVLPPGR